jgi:hypothetical protein
MNDNEYTPEVRKALKLLYRLKMSDIGKKGGRSCSKAKVRAARINGRKGGRPAKKINGFLLRIEVPKKLKEARHE